MNIEAGKLRTTKYFIMSSVNFWNKGFDLCDQEYVIQLEHAINAEQMERVIFLNRPLRKCKPRNMTSSRKFLISSIY